MNKTYMIIIRTVIALVYVISFSKYYRCKKHDKGMKIKLDIRSLSEILIVLGINASLYIIPMATINVLYATIVGNLMLFVTVFQLRRLFVVGDRLFYFKENMFLISDLGSFKIDGHKISFRIKNHPFKLNYPLCNLKLLEERFSAKKYRR